MSNDGFLCTQIPTPPCTLSNAPEYNLSVPFSQFKYSLLRSTRTRILQSLIGMQWESTICHGGSSVNLLNNECTCNDLSQPASASCATSSSLAAWNEALAMYNVCYRQDEISN